MTSWFWLVLGLGCGGFGTWLVWWNGRREFFRLEEDMQRLQQERTIAAEFMHNLVEAVGEGVDKTELYRRVVHAAVLSTGALSACVFEREDNRLSGVAVEGLFPPHRKLPESFASGAGTRASFLEQVLKSEVFEVGEGLVGRVAQSGKGILIADAERDPRVIKHEDAALRVRSCLVVPINARDRNLAVLAIVNRADGLAFGEMDRSLAESLAEQAGLALQNLELMSLQLERNRLEADLSLASNIQGMLLPRVFPSIKGLDLSNLYEPAQKIGGDLFDFIDLGEERYGVSIADVSGKGIPASLVMAIVQSNLGHIAKRTDSPAEALRQLNEVLYEETREEMFVTLVYAIIDLRRDTLTVARAGHEAPLLVSNGHDGEPPEVLELTPSGMGLGIVSDDLFAPTIEVVEVPFRVGDLLLLYTDGINEAVNLKHEEFGIDRLNSILGNLDGMGAEQVVLRVRRAVAEFTGRQPLRDDITLVAARRV